MPIGPSKKNEGLGQVRAKNRAAWRRWLEKHHAQATAVVLVYAHKASGEPSVSYEESVEEALCFGWIDGVRRKHDATHFTARFTPRKPRSIWSKLNLERVARLIAAGKMHASGLAAFEAGLRSGGHAKAYATREEVPMPEELHQELLRNRRGRAAFEALAPGQKKGWMRWISWAARPETRKQRAGEALLLVLAGRKAGETDNQAARRGIASKASILKGMSSVSGRGIEPSRRAPRPRGRS